MSLETDNWKLREMGVPIQIDNITAVTLKNRANAVFQQMEESLNSGLYSRIAKNIPQPTRWQNIARFVRRRVERVHDAWLVLSGRADIDGGW